MATRRIEIWLAPSHWRFEIRFSTSLGILLSFFERQRTGEREKQNYKHPPHGDRTALPNLDAPMPSARNGACHAIPMSPSALARARKSREVTKMPGASKISASTLGANIPCVLSCVDERETKRSRRATSGALRKKETTIRPFRFA